MKGFLRSQCLCNITNSTGSVMLLNFANVRSDALPQPGNLALRVLIADIDRREERICETSQSRFDSVSSGDGQNQYCLLCASYASASMVDFKDASIQSVPSVTWCNGLCSFLCIYFPLKPIVGFSKFISISSTSPRKKHPPPHFVYAEQDRNSSPSTIKEKRRTQSLSLSLSREIQATVAKDQSKEREKELLFIREIPVLPQPCDLDESVNNAPWYIASGGQPFTLWTTVSGVPGFDYAKNNAILGLMQYVEHRIEPEEFIATKYASIP
ncbi:hypothetical protein V8E51_000126 [Hyaloscypha variabilis]